MHFGKSNHAHAAFTTIANNMFSNKWILRFKDLFHFKPFLELSNGKNKRPLKGVGD